MKGTFKEGYSSRKNDNLAHSKETLLCLWCWFVRNLLLVNCSSHPAINSSHPAVSSSHFISLSTLFFVFCPSENHLVWLRVVIQCLPWWNSIWSMFTDLYWKHENMIQLRYVFAIHDMRKSTLRHLFHTETPENPQFALCVTSYDASVRKTLRTSKIAVLFYSFLSYFIRRHFYLSEGSRVVRPSGGRG